MRFRSKFLLGLGTAAAAGLVGRSMLRSSRYFAYAGKRVLVTGGSRGLGLELARALTAAGATVAICARDEAELARAAQDIAGFGALPLAIACDVRDEASAQRCVEIVVSAWGGIDVLFNVAGIINVGPLAAMTTADFDAAMATNCWGPLNMTRAAAPHMKAQRWGRIVNIASLGGKRAVPHMLPYAASKFALVGLSTGLRAELACDGIVVTTVCPGLMRTGSPRNAYFKGDHRKEYAWFSIGDSLPLLSIAADKAARQIMAAAQRGDAEASVSGGGQILALAQSLWPNLTAETMTLMNAVLPSFPEDEEAFVTRRGHECESPLSPSVLTTLTDDAAARNNEV